MVRITKKKKSTDIMTLSLSRKRKRRYCSSAKKLRKQNTEIDEEKYAERKGRMSKERQKGR